MHTEVPQGQQAKGLQDLASPYLRCWLNAKVSRKRHI